MEKNKIQKEYKNDEIAITWEPHKCIHAKNCWKELGSVFKPLKRPWVKADGASTDEIIKQIEKCPSGALGYYSLTEKENIKMEDNKMVSLKVNKNGSLKVTGEVEIVLPDGSTEIKSGRFSICRCGLSENKPFCDGAHKETGFDSNWEIEKAD